MDESISENDLKEVREAKIQAIGAERQKFISESERYKAERLKLERETAEIQKRLTQRWYHVRLVSLIQAIVGGLIAGGLVWAFALDHVVRLYNLQEEVEIQTEDLIKTKDQLSAQNSSLLQRQNELEENLELVRQSATRLQDEKRHFQTQVADLNRQINVLRQSLDTNAPKNTDVKLAEAQQSLDSITETATDSAIALSAQIDKLSEIQEKVSERTDETWFPVIASAYKEIDLRGKLYELGLKDITYKISVYRTADAAGVPVFAVTLGGYLKKSEASERANYARNNDIAPDAYVWNSSLWGENVINQFRE